MSLYIQICINNNDNNVIRTFGAQNIRKNADDGKPSTYRVCTYDSNGDGTARLRYLHGVIYHNREEGAVILSKKVLDFAISMGEL